MSFCFAEDIDDASYSVDDNSSVFDEEVHPDPDLRTITYNTSLSSSDKISYYGGSCNFNVYLQDNNNNYLQGQTIYSYIDGNLYNKTTNTNGKVVFTFNNLSLGDHIVYSYFEGNENYNPSSAVNFITVNTTIISKDLTKVYGNNTKFTTQFLKSNGAKLKNTNITFTINNVNYTYTTNNKGIIKLSVNWLPGLYNLTILNPMTQERSFYKITILPPIISSNLVKYYRNDSHFKVKVLGLDGQALGANETVLFTVKGVTYTRYSDSDGCAQLEINLYPGEYEITTSHNTYSCTNNISVLSPYGKIGDLVKYCRNETQFRVLILGPTGTHAGANENVQFTINGVTYNNVTDFRGYAMLTINLQPGVYNITTRYNGYNCYNTVTVLSRIITSDMTMQYHDGSYFSAVILDGHGNPFPNQNVTFKINNVNYVYTTDDYGIARITINLYQGTYSMRTTYDTISVTNTIIVATSSPTKKNTVITIISSSYTNPCNLVVRLKDSSGNPLANKSLLLKFNNTLFNRLTDNNGYIELTSLIPYGTYALNITFCGDHYYKNSNKIENIQINKRNTIIEYNLSSLCLLTNQYIDFHLKDTLGNHLSNQNLNVNISSNSYTLTTDGYGMARLKLDLASGDYQITVDYDGNSYYHASSNSTSMHINSTSFSYSLLIPNYVNLTNNWVIYDNSYTHNFIGRTGQNGVIHMPVVRQLEILLNDDVYCDYLIGHITSSEYNISYGDSRDIILDNCRVHIESDIQYTNITYYGYVNGNVNQICGVFPQVTFGNIFTDCEVFRLLVNDEIKLEVAFSIPLLWNEDGVRFAFMGNDFSQYPNILNRAYNTFNNYQGLIFAETGESVVFSSNYMNITNLPSYEMVITEFSFNNQSIVKDEWVSFARHLNSCGVEVVQRYAISNILISDDVMEYAIDRFNNYYFLFDESAYSSFLTALSTIWLFDETADSISDLFDVDVSREGYAVVMSGVDSSYNAYVHSVDPILALNFTGENSNNTYLCRALSSLLFGEIESQALNLSGRESNSSVSFIFSEILNGANFTLNFTDGILTIQLAGNENYTFIFDLNTGLVYDLTKYGNFTYKGAISNVVPNLCPYLFIDTITYNVQNYSLNNISNNYSSYLELSDTNKKILLEAGGSFSISGAAVAAPYALNSIVLIVVGGAITSTAALPIALCVSLIIIGYVLYYYADDNDPLRALGDVMYGFLQSMVV